ncbi:MAG: alpha/beta hydrolase [Bacteroidaceae bacterium]|nr:alpha/beta hydrolase [Bacteroidaceae bacterium]
MAGFLLIICLAAGILVYLNKPKWNDSYGNRYLDICYGENPHNNYDLYLPADASEIDSLALILYVHGGSWIGGDKDEHHRDCYTWVQKGYATATMNYSLLKEENVSLPTMLSEIGHCLEHIVQFSADHGAHICQIAIAGTSAGGHLAMMFAYNYRNSLPLKFEAIKVGPADFCLLFPNDTNATSEDIKKFVFCCTGKYINSKHNDKQWLDSIKMSASPITYISDSTALPAIFAYGDKDKLINPAHYKALAEKYDSMNKPYSLIVYPNSGHLLMNDKDCSEKYDSTLSIYCKRYFGY